MAKRNIVMYENNMNNYYLFEPVVRICNYFEVGDGAYWGWRVIPDYEFVLIACGRFVFQTRQAKFEAGRGSILYIEPLSEHYLAHIPEYGKGIIACIHSDPFSSPANSRQSPPPIAPLTDVSKDYDFFNAAFAFAARKFGYFDKQSIALQKSIVKTIWLSLADHGQGGNIKKRLSAPTEAIVEWIRENIEKKITRKDIARKFLYTPEHINYLFRNELGVTTSQFISREKVLRGFNLIRQDGLSVKEAAAALGFTDQYHFSKVFKKIIGKNPSEYKEFFRL